MPSRSFTRRLALLASAASVFAPQVAAAQDAAVSRALIVTLSYRNTPEYRLANTTNDGVLIASVLNDLEFNSVDIVLDPDAADLSRELNAYISRLSRTDIAFVYVAGHGVQIDGRNYLLMNDSVSLVDIAQMISALRRASNSVVFLLDACRNNPFDRGADGGRSLRAARDITVRPATEGEQFAFVSIESGQTSAGRVGEFELGGTGVALMYATDPRNRAADYVAVTDRNSPFAVALAARLREQRVLSSVMSAVVEDVSARTNGQQSPWWAGSVRDIYFAGRPATGNPTRIPRDIPG